MNTHNDGSQPAQPQVGRGRGTGRHEQAEAWAMVVAGPGLNVGSSIDNGISFLNLTVIDLL